MLIIPVRPSHVILLSAIAVLLSSCTSTPPYRYQYVRGRTAELQWGHIDLPRDAPRAVRAAAAAAESIQGRPYVYGGGHRRIEDYGYDCSGSVSYVLYHAGLLRSPLASNELRGYGSSGPGRWITIYASNGHAFMTIAGVRFDTGYSGQSEGPRLSTRPRPAKGFVLRHPPGL